MRESTAQLGNVFGNWGWDIQSGFDTKHMVHGYSFQVLLESPGGATTSVQSEE
jgi:hypothetical protein